MSHKMDKEMTDQIENTEKQENGVADNAIPSTKEKKSRASKKLKTETVKADKLLATVSDVPQPEFIIATSLTRPLNPVVNTIVYETDTGNRVQFNGINWNHIDNLH